MVEVGPQSQVVSAWWIKDFDVGAGVAAGAFAEPVDGWIAAAAPGDVYLALHSAGRIRDPFEDGGEEACAWVADREWWWRCDLEAPALDAGQRLILSFEGLDTFADVWLNGEQIASWSNMFRPLTLDVTEKARPGLNQLAVAFTPPSYAMRDATPPLWAGAIGEALAKNKRNAMRKAQFSWGWDWGPTLPTVGVWKPVRLKVQTGAALTDVAFATTGLTADRSRAEVAANLAVDAFAPRGALSAKVRLVAPDGSAAGERILDVSGGERAAVFRLDHPRLWWTPELGAADRYDLEVTLFDDADVIDCRAMKVGVRTIAIDQSPDPDEPGATFFRFLLNGISVFARGACWIPADSFVARVDEPRYRDLLEKARDANMNMIRIWGGGVYEHDAFYDVCDELGLLVWQDFMFACAPYPEDDAAFVESVRGEIRDQIVRLRSHPSLAVWCGNNECQVIQSIVNMRTGKDDPTPGDLYYEQIMPQLAAELDPHTPYWPGSPYGGPNAGSMIAGDVHDWTVWHGVPPIPVDKPVGGFSIAPEAVAYTRYAEDMARFVSEFGIQASPAMETLKRALPPAERAYGSEGLARRIKDHPKNKVDAMLVTVTGLPTELQEYVDFTQITQAEGLKFGIEHFRRRTPHCSGALIWQLNDCWPGISWSVLDYYGFGKAGYFYTRRVFAPVLASFKPVGEGAFELWVSNDTASPVKGEAEVTFQAASGQTHWTKTVALDVGPTESRCVWRGQAAGGPADILWVRSPADAFPGNRWFFAPIKDLDRSAATAPQVSVTARDAQTVEVTVQAETPVWFVHALVDEPAARFSDNYVDLMAGEARTLVIHNPKGPIAPGDVSVRWR